MEDLVRINLKELLIYVFSKWRSLIISILAFAILFQGIATYKNYTAIKAQNTGSDIEQNLDAKKEGLSASEIKMVEDACQTKTIYEQSLEAAISYSNESIKMQLDAYNVPTITMVYLVDSHYEAVYPVIEKKDYTEDILGSLRSVTISPDVCNKIGSDIDLEVNNNVYIKELISNEKLANSEQNDLLTITLIANNEDNCNIMADDIHEAIIDSLDSLTEIYGKFDVTLVDRQFHKSVNESLLTAQQNQQSTISKMQSNITALTSNMTTAQQEYFIALTNSNEENGNLDQEREEQKFSFVSSISKKYIAVGVIIGLFLCGAYWALSYILTKKLRSKKDLEYCTQTSVLGSLYVQKPGFKQKSLDKVLLAKSDDVNLQFTNDEVMDMICAGVRISAKKKNMNTLYITGTYYDESINQISNEICDRLKKDFTTVLTGKSVIFNPKSLENLAESDGVILIEKIGKADCTEIKQEVEICEKQNVTIIGTVSVRE